MYRKPLVPVKKKNLYIDPYFNDSVSHPYTNHVIDNGLSKGFRNMVECDRDCHKLSSQRGVESSWVSQKNLKVYLGKIHPKLVGNPSPLVSVSTLHTPRTRLTKNFNIKRYNQQTFTKKLKIKINPVKVNRILIIL